MKRAWLIALIILLAGLVSCGPNDGKPEIIAAGMAGEGEVSRTAAWEPEQIEGWGDGISSFAAYSWNGALLENVQGELDADLGEIWWINDEAVSELYGEDVFADGSCYDGVFHFAFSSTQPDSELAAAAGIADEELRLWAREWDWPSYGYMARGWELAVTYAPLPEGGWVTPSWWLPPEGLTGKGEDLYGYHDERAIAGPFDADGNPIPTPEPTPFPEDRQAVEDFRFPAWEPVKDHAGYEMAIVHASYDGRPMQVRLRWKNEEGFGFWAQLPAHALESFWKHENEWFVKVSVPGGDSGSYGSSSHAGTSE